MTDHLLDAATAYVKRGWAVIPLHHIGDDGVCTCHKGPRCQTPAKHPIWNDWPTRGLTSPPDVYAIWVEEHPGANIGIVTGASSGVWALDVDPAKGGFDSLSGLVAEHGALPRTRMHTTGSGGLHYLFAQPPGVIVPTTASSLGAGIDTRGDGNGQVVAPPSRSDKGGYGVLADIDPQPAPDWLLERLVEVQRRRDLGTEAQIVAGAPIDVNGLPAKLLERLADLDAKDRSAHFHGTVAAARRAGLTQAQTVTVLRLWCDVIGKYVGRVEAEVARSWGKLNDADPINDPDRYVEELTRTGSADPVLADVHAMITLARTYQDLPDPSHILLTLAVAATRDFDDDPVWLLLVAPPSSGKTEAVRTLKTCADAHLDDVTAAGMLSWKTGKNPRPTGILSRVGNRALVTFGDLSSLLAGSDTGARDAAFAILRKAYDGHVVRDLGNAPEALSWTGKLTVIGAVTGAIDRYAAHNDALGARWVYFRLAHRDTKGKRRAADLARHGGLDVRRDQLAVKAAQVVYAARGRISAVQVPDRIVAAVMDAALVTCWGRASIPRHWSGRREIDGMAVVEEPPRVVRQLLGVARGLLSLGLDDDTVEALVRRVALDSMPANRAAVLTALTVLDAPASTSVIAAREDIDRGVARRTLEELELIGIVAASRSGTEPGDMEPDRRFVYWSLTGEDGNLVKLIFKKALTCNETWLENMGAPPHPPKYRDSQDQFFRGAPITSNQDASQVGAPPGAVSGGGA